MILSPRSIPAAEQALHPPRLGRCVALAAPVALIALAGCVDVPEQSPMGGAPMQDAAPPDAAPHDGGDGSRPDVDRVDHDDPAAPEVDGGDPGGGDVEYTGRPEDARPGPESDDERPLFAGLDPVRCPDGGALLPALAACAIIEPLPPLPAAVVMAVAVALPDGRVLVAGGAATAEAPSRADSWVLEDDDWRAGPPLPEPVRGARAVVRDGRAVIIGGLGGPAAGSTVQTIGPDDGGLPSTMLGQPRHRGFSAHRVADRIVVIGGETLGEGVAGVEQAPGPQDAEDAVLEQLAVARRDHAAAVDVDGALWVLGGRDRRGQVRFAPEVLYPDDVEWDAAPGPAGWAFDHGAAAPTGDTVLFAGGVDPDGRVLGRAGVYDHDMQSWLPVGGLNTPQSALVMAPLGDAGAVLAIGPGTLEIFDPVEQAFRLLAAAGPLLRSDPAVVVVDGQVMVIGGSSSGRVLPDAYAVRLEPAEPPAADEDEPEEERR